MLLQDKFNDIGITALKIYYDPDTGKFIHNYVCDECGDFLFRSCYPNLEYAVKYASNEVTCQPCSLKSKMSHDTSLMSHVITVIRDGEDPQRIEDIADYIVNMLDSDEITRILRGA